MIELRGVESSYRTLTGRRRAVLRGVDLRVPPGAATALVGPNGAGKSTLFGLVLGFLRPDAGTVRLFGRPPRAYARRAGIAYLPERVELPSHLSPRALLRRLGRLDGLTGRDARAAAVRALARTGLEAVARRPFRALSRGQRQRLGVAQLLLRPRRAMLLDEPFAGLDPTGRRILRELFREWGRADPPPAVLVATHDLGEAARVARRAAVLHRGRAGPAVCLETGGAPGAPLRRLEAAYAVRVRGDRAGDDGA